MQEHFLEELKNDIKGPIGEPDKPDSKLKKILLLGVGIFLVFLMVSFVFVTHPVATILEGKIESDILIGNKLELDTFMLFFEKGTDQTLKDLYFAQQDVEFSVCLQGEKVGKNYYINSLYQPTMYQQTFNHVSFEPCSADSLILLHTHPYKSCVASQTDLNTLNAMKERNPDVLMIVMCEPQRFSVYN